MEKYKVLFIGATNYIEKTFKTENSSEFTILHTDSCKNGSYLLENEPFEAIVCSSDIPINDSLDFFKANAEKKPSTIRYLVVSENDNRFYTNNANIIHQFFPDSDNIESIFVLLENSLILKKRITSKEVIERINSVKTLPSPPETYNQVMEEFQNEDPSMTKISDIIAKDIGVTTKLLQLVNSAYFGLNAKVSNLQQAVNLVGLDTIKAIVFTTGIFKEFDKVKAGKISAESIYKKSMNVGARSRLIAHTFGLNKRISNDALFAGLLNDIGKLLMLVEFREELKIAFEIAEKKTIPIRQAQLDTFGVDDASMGAYLLSLWGLPEPIIETVALHECPKDCPNPSLNTLAAVHLGYALETDEINNVVSDENSAIDDEYITRLGIKNQIPTLRGFALGAVF